MRNLYAGQEATVRTGHGTTDWFQIGVKRSEAKSKGEKERYPFECRVPKNSKEIRKPFSVINAKK